TLCVLVVAGVVGWMATALHGVTGAGSSAPAASSAQLAGGASTAPAPIGAQDRVQGTLGSIVGGVGRMPGVGPRIVKQASIRLQVKKGSFLDRFQQAVSVAAANGGFVETSDTTVGRFRTGVITVRVPADRF